MEPSGEVFAYLQEAFEESAQRQAGKTNTMCGGF
jgi:hypothetical protein